MVLKIVNSSEICYWIIYWNYQNVLSMIIIGSIYNWKYIIHIYLFISSTNLCTFTNIFYRISWYQFTWWIFIWPQDYNNVQYCNKKTQKFLQNIQKKKGKSMSLSASTWMKFHECSSLHSMPNLQMPIVKQFDECKLSFQRIQYVVSLCNENQTQISFLRMIVRTYY